MSQRTFVVLGIDENQGKKTVKGVLELVYDPARNKIGGLSIDPSTYVSVPGRGFQSINEGLIEGAKNLAAGVSDMVGVKAEGYAVVKGDVFTDIVDNKKPGEIFSSMDEGSVSNGRAKKLSGDLGNIPQARVTFMPLPVKTMIIGEQTYYEPNKADLKRIVMLLWGRQPAPAETATRVIILNGSGAPGIARDAADRIIGKGFKILDVKNADKFTYTQTEILIYDKKLKSRGKTVAKALGAGIVVEKGAAQDVTDIVIVIGKDFH
ncbi:MAG: LCP family protein [Actinomycetota bacterium]|nr:LCP family protein [Actinomycetota bacterium]